MTDSKESEEVVSEQIPARVLNFSSQYGSNIGRNYNIDNICTRPEIYPSYGDSTHALVFRTYGPWWTNLPSHRLIRRNFQRREDHFTSRDFIEIEYPNLVHCCHTLNIYETYNPGTLEVVYVGKEDEPGTITWHEVWRFPDRFTVTLCDEREIGIENGRQRMQDLFPDHISTVTAAMHSLDLNTDHHQIAKIHTRHTYPPAARIPRIVRIPLKEKVSFPTRHVRLEFDHCTANYYIEIDTITLSGNTTPNDVTPPATAEVDQALENNPSMDLTKLPFDLLFLICSYLDLRSLVRLSSTTRYFRQHCLYPLQFKSLNLQPYWNTITDKSIEQFFTNYVSQTRYLSLAWTRSIHLSTFSQFLNICSNHLLQLNLACCQYLTKDYISAIVNSCPNIEILNLDNCMNLTGDDFLPLKELHHLRSLNVYRTRIDFRTLIPLIDNNKEHLEHLNLGSCQYLADVVGIARLLFGRCSNLRSLDLWRASQLTPNGYLSIVGLPYDIDEEEARFSNLSADGQEALALVYSLHNMPVEFTPLTHMTGLSEIDIGWTDPPAGFVAQLVHQAGRSLLKIFLTACRRISNEDIIAVSKNCPKLQQLDLLGSNVIGEYAIECVLQQCPNLQFLDLSFCSKISDATIEKWIGQYRNCFKRSYSPAPNADVYQEFD